MDIKKYTEISTDVWKLFRDKQTNVITWDAFWDGVHELNNKYEGHEGYTLMQKLLKVYFDELKEVNG